MVLRRDKARRRRDEQKYLCVLIVSEERLDPAGYKLAAVTSSAR